MSDFDEVKAVADVREDLDALTRDLANSPAAVDQASGVFIADFFALIKAKGSQLAVSGMITLPLHVHGAVTGNPWPAKPAAVIHLLWWAAARFLDDLADMKDPSALDLGANKKVLTSIAVGCHLPTRLICELAVPSETKVRMSEEVARCSFDGISGQLTDLSSRAQTATPDSVLESYRGKTGAPYAMAAALGAVLAGASIERTANWREFGRSFGVLRQLVNDQRDLVTGRNEDLANGTPTYLLASALHSASPSRRAEMLALHSAAATSPQAREELAGWLMSKDGLHGYSLSVDGIIRAARDLLDSLGGDASHVKGLRDLVDQTVGFLPAIQGRP